MAIFNSYVSLPEGIPIFCGCHHPRLGTAFLLQFLKGFPGAFLAIPIFWGRSCGNIEKMDMI